jgi:hypothetical protein
MMTKGDFFEGAIRLFFIKVSNLRAPECAMLGAL